MLLAALLVAAAALPPAPTQGFILDEAGVLSPGQVAALNRQIKAVSDHGAGQIGILLTNDLRGMTRNELAPKVFRAWGIGYGDRGPTGNGRGLLILAKVSPPDRGVRVEVGHDLEGRLNDGKVGAITRESIPDFSAGRWADGLGRMLSTFAGEMTVEAREVAAPVRPAVAPAKGWPWWMWAALFGLVGAAAIAGMVAFARRRKRVAPAPMDPIRPVERTPRRAEPAVDQYVPPLYMPSPLQPIVIVPPVVETHHHHHHTYESPAPSYSPDPSPSDSGSSWSSDSSSSDSGASFGGGGDSSGGGSDSSF